MTPIVTTHYRYKRPPWREKPVALEVPAVVKAGKPLGTTRTQPETAGTQPAMLTTIVTARRPRAAKILPPGLLPDTPEEHKRRGDLADAMVQAMKRKIAETRR